MIRTSFKSLIVIACLFAILAFPIQAQSPDDSAVSTSVPKRAWTELRFYDATDTDLLLYKCLAPAVVAQTTMTITAATNATPIVITVGSETHGLKDGSLVTISGVLGNTAANGVRQIVSTGTSAFSLKTVAGADVAGNGTYTSGGTVYTTAPRTNKAHWGVQVFEYDGNVQLIRTSWAAVTSGATSGQICANRATLPRQ